MFFDVQVNGHIIGTVMREIIRRQINIIRAERFSFEVEEKLGYSGEMDDIRTSGDIKSNEEAIAKIKRCFPGFGIITEESKMVPCTLPGLDLYFTLDPLDGTRAYFRRQSDGFGPMIALISENKVIAAYVGDAMTREVYGFHSDSQTVHRISDFNRGESLADVHNKKLCKTFVLLRNNPYELSKTAQKMLQPDRKGLFAGININGGSIGLSMAKIWKGEFSAAILKTNTFTPWDMCPIIGICQKLNYVFLEIKDDALQAINIVPPRNIRRKKQEILIIHEKYLPELFIWAQANL